MEIININEYLTKNVGVFTAVTEQQLGSDKTKTTIYLISQLKQLEKFFKKAIKKPEQYRVQGFISDKIDIKYVFMMSCFQKLNNVVDYMLNNSNLVKNIIAEQTQTGDFSKRNADYYITHYLADRKVKAKLMDDYDELYDQAFSNKETKPQETPIKKELIIKTRNKTILVKGLSARSVIDKSSAPEDADQQEHTLK